LIGHRFSSARQNVAGSKLMLGLSGFADAYLKGSFLPPTIPWTRRPYRS
jgi:hypothetical protein